MLLPILLMNAGLVLPRCFQSVGLSEQLSLFFKKFLFESNSNVFEVLSIVHQIPCANMIVVNELFIDKKASSVRHVAPHKPILQTAPGKIILGR